MESHSNMLIIWLIVFGVILILAVGGAAYFLSAPSTPVIVSNGSSSVTASSKAGSGSDGQKWTKGHYANLFYEFDYIDIFKVTAEEVTTDHTADTEGRSLFGNTRVVLSGTNEASNGGYEITITSHPNYDQTPPAELITGAKDTFFKQQNHGQNDAFQMMEINGKDAYKEYAGNAIIIGIPTGNLIHELRITWIGTTGSADAANDYISALTDSYTFK